MQKSRFVYKFLAVFFTISLFFSFGQAETAFRASPPPFTAEEEVWVENYISCEIAQLKGETQKIDPNSEDIPPPPPFSAGEELKLISFITQETNRSVTEHKNKIPTEEELSRQKERVRFWKKKRDSKKNYVTKEEAEKRLRARRLEILNKYNEDFEKFLKEENKNRNSKNKSPKRIILRNFFSRFINVNVKLNNSGHVTAGGSVIQNNS